MAGTTKRYSSAATLQKYDAIVVGSGMGGLCTAALLAKAGKRVLVLERHYVAGGFTHTFKREGYEWDVGLHYVGEVFDKNNPFRKLLNRVTNSKLQFQKMPDTYDRFHFPDATYDFKSGTDAFRDQLIQYFPGESKAIHGYVNLLKNFQDKVAGFMLSKILPSGLSPIKYLLARKFSKFSDQSTYEVLRGLTSNEKLIGVLSSQFGDYGLPPKQSSFAIHAMVASHYLEGGAYPIGGSSEIANHIAAVIEEADGQILVQAEVDKILVHGNRAIGVKLANGDEHYSPLIISNVGVRNTYAKLLPPSSITEEASQTLKPIKPSVGHYCLYLGLKGNPPELGIDGANRWIFPGYDHDENVARFLIDPKAPLPVTYISFPSAKDPVWNKTHPGKATIEIIVPAPYERFEKWKETKWRKRGEEYESHKEAISKQLVEVLSQYLPKIPEKIDYRELSTPLSTAHFSNYASGEMYGLEHTPERFRSKWLTPLTPFKGLYLTGQDVVTVGIAGAAFSGLLTASAILRKNIMKDL